MSLHNMHYEKSECGINEHVNSLKGIYRSTTHVIALIYVVCPSVKMKKLYG